VRTHETKGGSLRSLHCYAEGQDGDWEAVCLDLDIAVQGRSFEEVFNSLRAAVSLYFQAVADLPSEQRSALLHRAVPLSIRLKFLLHAMRGLFAGGDTRQRHQFTMAVAA
jgi:ADP-heptose:LPS heptosyltransferase